MRCAEPHGKNTAPGLKVLCQRDPKCHGYEVRGNKDFGTGSYCVGEVKFGDGSDDDTIGMKGLKDHEGATVFIKSRYKSNIKLKFPYRNMLYMIAYFIDRPNLYNVFLSFRYMF